MTVATDGGPVRGRAPVAPGGGETNAGLLGVLAAVFLAVNWCLVAAHLVRAGFERHPWIVGDWLIRYAGGFVRRGLPGEIVAGLSTLTGIPPHAWVTLAQLSLLALFFVQAARLARPLLRDWAGRALFFSPAHFSFWALDPEGAGRKELLVLVLLTGYALMLQQECILLRSDRLHGTFVAAGLTVVTLAHEMLFLYCPFFLALYLISRQGASTVPSALRWAFVPPTVVFVASALRHGDATVARSICASWGESAPVDCLGFSAIGYLAKDLPGAVAEVAASARNFGMFTTYAGCLALGVAPFVWLLCRLWRRGRLPRLGTAPRRILFSACLLAPAPLFTVSFDWGRVLNTWLVGWFVLATVGLSRESSRLDRSIGHPGGQAGGRLRIALAALLVVAYASCWNMPHSRETIGPGFAGRLRERLELPTLPNGGGGELEPDAGARRGHADDARARDPRNASPTGTQLVPPPVLHGLTAAPGRSRS